MTLLVAELSDNDAALLQRIANWCGDGIPIGEVVGACIARAHDDMLIAGLLPAVGHEGIEPSSTG